MTTTQTSYTYDQLLSFFVIQERANGEKSGQRPTLLMMSSR